METSMEVKMNISRLCVVAMSCLVTATCGFATGAPLGVEQVTFCRLRYELTTTAEGARITAQETDHLLTGRLLGVSGTPFKHGATLQSVWLSQQTVGGSVGVTVDYAASSDRPWTTVPHSFEQIGEGASVLRVSYVTEVGAELLAEIVHPGGARLPFDLDLTPLTGRSCSTGTIPARPEKMLWAYYYPWYVENDWDVSILQDRPTLGYYGSNRRGVIEQHVSQAQEAGIEGFISSWWGPGSYTDENLQTLLDVAQARRFGVMINFELLNYAGQPLSTAEVVRWLRYAMSTYGDHPAIMRLDGRPVFVIWASETISGASWREIRARLQAEGLDPFLLGQFAGAWARLEDLDVFDGLYQYNILNVMQRNDQVDILAGVYKTTGSTAQHYPLLMDAPALRLWAATVQPGYDDHLIPGRTSPILERRDGTLYRAVLDAALHSDPDWVFITSWNEWWEHTYIEPGSLYGEQYLDITREYARRWQQRRIYLPILRHRTGAS